MRRMLGFTLIEVIVVVGIIGILSSVIYASFGDARADARNKAMMSELKEVQLALELYRAQNGSYPLAFTGACDGNFYAYTSNVNPCNLIPNEYIVGLVPDYIAGLPNSEDSSNPDCRVKYEVNAASDPSWYKLTAENCVSGADTATEGIQADEEFSKCPGSCSSGGCGDEDLNGTLDTYNPSDDGFYNSMAVYSAGGQCQ